MKMKYNCELCGFQTDVPQSWGRHLRTEHGGRETYELLTATQQARTNRRAGKKAAKPSARVEEPVHYSGEGGRFEQKHNELKAVMLEAIEKLDYEAATKHVGALKRLSDLAAQLNAVNE